LETVPLSISVADPDQGSGAFLTTRSGIRDGKKIWIRIRDEQPGSYFRELGKKFFGVTILQFFYADPVSGMEKIRTRDKHPGSATLLSISKQKFKYRRKGNRRRRGKKERKLVKGGDGKKG
jgi:hypothetical protein